MAGHGMLALLRFVWEQLLGLRTRTRTFVVEVAALVDGIVSSLIASVFKRDSTAPTPAPAAPPAEGPAKSGDEDGMQGPLLEAALRR